MKGLRNGILALMALCVGLQFVACSTLALNGDKRYKVELNNIFLNVQSDFDKEGGATPQTRKKLDELITKYEADYGKKASFTCMKQMRDAINEAEADPNNKFSKYQVALQLKNEAEDYLTTEIKQS
jgi:hypothetical protein